MKKILSYIIGGATMVGALAMSSCTDDYDNPVIVAPEATLKPNMTIMELKQMYWNDAVNFIDTIGIDNGVADDAQYIIHGRVISSDEAGNVFKSLVIQDETAALALSINSYNLYLNYRVGQELVIDLKGMYIGKYNGLLQLGMPEWYEAGNAWEATFMAPEFFQSHVQLNGWPEAEKIDTLQINNFSDLPSNPDGLCRFQSQLVKFNNVYFQNGGKEQFSEYHSSGVNQNIIDAAGGSLPVRTSGYSNFWNNTLPSGNGDVVAILSYYGTTGWQLLLNDYEGCMNFGNPTVAPGAEDNPYSVDEAISAIKAGRLRSGWVSGYIVGAVAPEVVEVKSNSDIEWSADVVLDNTLVIGATPDTKDLEQALVIALPMDSKLRQYGNLVDNPGNYKKAISVRGTFGTYMGTYGVLDNSGAPAQFNIEGVELGIANGNGSQAAPYNVEQVIAKNPSGSEAAPDESNVWVQGFIVGYVDTNVKTYVTAESAKFSAPAVIESNLLLAPEADCTDYTQCIAIQLPVGGIRTALNLKSNPGNLGREVKLFGNIAKYCGVGGMRTTSQYEWVGDAPSSPDVPDTPAGDPKGSGTAADPFNVVKALEVAKANGQTSDVVYYTQGYVISGSINMSFGDGTWVIADNANGAGATITVYHAKGPGNKTFTDENAVKIGDKIVVCAPLINFNGNTPETKDGYVYSINGQTGDSSTPDTPATPDTPLTGAGTEDNPYTVADVIGGATGSAVWTKGYIVGWIDGAVYATGANFNSNSTSETNLILAASPDETDPAKCVPVQLPAGTIRSELNLKANPGNYKKQVILCGSLEQYFRTNGIKSVSAYKFE